MTTTPTTPHPTSMGDTANKVATVTLAFWVMKICATTVGETAGDMFSMTFNLGYAASSLMLLTFFAAVLGMQLRAHHFHPTLYWAVVLATSTAGTTVSDFMDRTLALGYPTGAAILSTLLVGVLLAWRRTTGNLSVNAITNPVNEAFYWLAILVSNTLGTALGDFLADSSGLGYGWSNLLIGSGIAVIGLLYLSKRVSPTVLFWAAYVLTRPFGATMGDLLTKPPAHGGLGLGTIGSSAVLLAVLAGMMIVTSRKNNETN